MLMAVKTPEGSVVKNVQIERIFCFLCVSHSKSSRVPDPYVSTRM